MGSKIFYGDIITLDKMYDVLLLFYISDVPRLLHIIILWYDVLWLMHNLSKAHFFICEDQYHAFSKSGVMSSAVCLPTYLYLTIYHL